MANGDLTPSESAILIVLMSEAREMLNTELKQRYGIDVKKATRIKLNDLGYVDSREERPTYAHQLADKGWVRIENELDFDSPRARALGGALSALHGNLRARMLPRIGYRTLGEMFSRADLPVLGVPERPAGLELRIRNAYGALRAEPGAWVGLARLRPFFGDVPAEDFDEALRQLNRAPDVNIVPESNQKILKPADVAAAVHIGGQDKHLLAIGV